MVVLTALQLVFDVLGASFGNYCHYLPLVSGLSGKKVRCSAHTSEMSFQMPVSAGLRLFRILRESSDVIEV